MVSVIKPAAGPLRSLRRAIGNVMGRCIACCKKKDHVLSNNYQRSGN
jgi:hypothetical protein